MRAFVFLASIAVASSGRVEFSLIDSGPRDKVIGLIKPHAGNALKAAAKSAKPSAVGSVLKAAAKNAKPPVAGKPQGLPKMFQAPVPVPKGHSNAPRLNLPKVKPPSAIMNAIMEPTVNRMEVEAIAKARKEGNGGVSPKQEVEVEESHSDGTQSDMMGKSIVNEIEAGAKGSGIVTIEGHELHFGTEDAKAAIESLNWVPGTEDANDILKKHECWPGQPPCDTPRTAMDWVADYSSSYKYAKNVCRATRGDVAEIAEKAPAACFDSRFVTAEQATACSFNYGVALTAALALQPNMGEQELYRGCKQPVELVQKLQRLAGGKETFVFPGVSSFSANRDHARKFMEVGTFAENDVRVMYHIKTDRARSVEGAMGEEFKKRGKIQEWESVMPPGQTMDVVSVRTVTLKTGDCYYVTLQDAAPQRNELSMD